MSTFEMLYKSFDSISKTIGICMVVGYYHATCGHVVTIDLKKQLILDSDKKHPLPFHFNTCKEFYHILRTCFNVVDCRDSVISHVFVLQRM